MTGKKRRKEKVKRKKQTRKRKLWKVIGGNNEKFKIKNINQN